MINIQDYTPTFANVLLKVEKEDYVSILTQKVKTSSGGIIEFDFDHYITPAREIKNSREIMQVISIGPECAFCIPGDLAIIDYTVDEGQDHIVYEDDKFIYYCLDETRNIVQEDHGVFNPIGSYCPIYSKGDCNRESLIYGVIRNEKIICNENYVIFKFEEVDDLYELNQDGVWLPKSQSAGDYTKLTIEFTSYNSKYKTGDKVMVYEYFTFTKNIQCNAFLMAYEQDISGVLK